MNQDHCPYEEEVLAAVSAGRLGDTLSAHVAGCPCCSEVRLVALAMRSLAAVEDPRPLPDPKPIWIRADHARRAEAARNAVLPIVILQRLSVVLAVAIGCCAAIWSWPQLRSWLSALPTPSLPSLTPAAGLPQPAVITMIGVGVILMVVLHELVGSWGQGLRARD